jgi:hypothetical protein
MKKLLALLLVLVFCFSLVACKKEEEKDPNEEIRLAVHTRIIFEVGFGYEDVKTRDVTYFIEEAEEPNTFNVSGKVTVVDKYGDTYTGKYDAIVIYSEIDDKYNVSSLDLDKLYKDK